jgi:hypothetical protein
VRPAVCGARVGSETGDGRSIRVGVNSQVRHATRCGEPFALQSGVLPAILNGKKNSSALVSVPSMSISALGATYVVVLPPSDKAVEMAQACLASPALGGAGLRPPPAVGRRRGSGAAVGSRARCARQPGARRAPAPSHSSEKNVHHPRGIWVSCGAARDPGDGDDEDGPSTSEPRMAPPTPSPVFSRRPMSARQRKVLNERVLARPPPRARGRKRRGAGIWPVAAGVAAAG